MLRRIVVVAVLACASLASVLSLGACHTTSTEQSSAPPLDAATVALQGDASAAVLAAATPSKFGSDAGAGDVKALVLEWNRALDAHDLGALDHLYADRVRFYDRDVPKSAVLAAKRPALSATSTFHQTIIGDIAVTLDDDKESSATFTKRSGNAGKMREVKAKIVVRSGDGGTLRITEETDDVTSKREVAAVCETEAARVVNDLPAVKTNLAAAKKAADAFDGSPGDAPHMGGMGPNQDADGSFTVGLGTFDKDRFDAEVWYTVDASGHLSVTVLAEDIPVPPAALAAVAKACGH